VHLNGFDKYNIPGEFEEHGGYDMMTSGVSAGPAGLDGASYGQKRCIDMEPDAKDSMMSDASMISAAPELLEALEELLRLENHSAVTAKAIAAIAKARGQ